MMICRDLQPLGVKQKFNDLAWDVKQIQESRLGNQKVLVCIDCVFVMEKHHNERVKKCLFDVVVARSIVMVALLCQCDVL